MSGPRVLYLVTEPWYFVNHRLDHARALLRAGFDVHVATRMGDRWIEAEAAGCSMHQIDLARSGGVREAANEFRRVRRLVRALRPDVVHAVALKPIAISLGLLAARRRPALILSVNGLGLTAATGGARVRVLAAVLRLAARRRHVQLLFQTESDRAAVLRGRDGGVVIPGVGVDVERFKPGHRTARPPLQVVYLGRAVASKGLLDLAAASTLLPDDLVHVRAYCSRDDESPGALTEAEWEVLRGSQLETCEPTSSPEDVLGVAHLAVLPSRAGEGVSKFVLEALASGTPVAIASESGSTEVIEPGVTGVLFTAADPASLRDALVEVSNWSEARMEEARQRCREVAVQRYGLDVILPQIERLHREAANP